MFIYIYINGVAGKGSCAATKGDRLQGEAKGTTKLNL